MAENLHNRKIKMMRSDNYGEYRSSDFNKYLAKLGIQRQLTIPESPQQNGVSERMNQILMNRTRCLLIESGLCPKFWAEAVSTAAYLRNKCPSAAIDGNIPERIRSDKEVNINHIRVFGCRAWSHVRSHSIQSKLDSKAKECVLVDILRVSRVTSYGT
ncbi:Retrovirus-related Pol polyprotein from transposon TNT 1-94 [Araneus ventricosus]|uniref:Retrovirus-related Pol polyprotein from transposon TNT 1-94 n=1 Tax=Araneus ventricosus TaxID=182803 RepID=A0A4Y2EL85_ARAVE|nr:Retrovirus-related Pol polyprotein from transposon TNT 1-94 [Araneus ventricosus]GBM28594.1 Retrovirus-related Pol polyprotein from transposon TNT 1-94 [Araneus ventricosus]